MTVRRPVRLRPHAALAAAAGLLLALAACTENYPRSTLAPASDFARVIDDLFAVITWWGLAVFVVVEALLLYIVVRYRRRAGAGADRPQQIHGHTRLEIAWTVAPALILVFIAVPTVRTIFVTQDEKPVPGAVNVRVLAHQWWWEFQYPDHDVVTANELVVPVGRPTSFRLEAADVIHSFWIPQLGGKRDAIPLHENRLWFTPDSAGVYLGQCAEFCGTAHALMGFRLRAVPEAEFEEWLRHQAAPAIGAAPAPDAAGGAPGAGGEGAAAGEGGGAEAGTAEGQAAAPGRPATAEEAAETTAARQAVDTVAGQDPGAARLPTPGLPEEATEPGALAGGAGPGSAARGAQLFQRSACIACHTVRGTNAQGKLGPDLTHLASRTRIAAELLPNTPEALARWLADPPAVKPGAKMPKLNLPDDQIADLVAYLRTLE
jgi:cytochrome c oxidase subunit 2